MATISDSDKTDASLTSGHRVPGSADKRVIDRLDEPIPEEGEPCIWQGRPCILYGLWDTAEDWSGEYVTFRHPYSVSASPKIGVSEFWGLVRDVHRLK